MKKREGGQERRGTEKEQRRGIVEMASRMSREEKKKMAALSAASLVDDGMVVGLGTGSTAEIVMRRLSERMKEDGIQISGVPTSFRTEMKAIELGIPIVSLSEHPALDIYIDGADEFDAKLNLIKGGWGSHTREKVVSYAAKRVVICVEEEKGSTFLRRPVPIEVLPFAFKVVEQQVKTLGGVPKLRTDERGRVFVTDNGNIVMDADFGVVDDPKELSISISSIAGVVEHGIFTNATEVHIGTADGVVIRHKEEVHCCHKA